MRSIPSYRPEFVLGLVLFMAAPIRLGAEARSVLNSAGVRAGGSITSVGRFRQTELFATHSLPWSWDLGADWQLMTGLEGSLGWLGDDRSNAALFKTGFTLAAGQTEGPVSFDVGFSPTVLSETVFDTKDFGMHLQFTSHAGLNFRVSAHFSVGYRAQHMSNGGFADPNPGLNTHMFSVSYRF